MNLAPAGSEFPVQPLGQILTVEQMRAAEQALIEGGETVSSLMETAGSGAAGYVLRMSGGRPVTVLCGPGNNGGDGYVIARYLHERAIPVQVVAPLAPATQAAIAARSAYRGPILDEASGQPLGRATGEVFVDCLFGSGLSRPLDEGVADLLRRLARAHRIAIAIDLPSGIESDSGAILTASLPEYRLTISLGAWKFAHWLMPSLAMMGKRRLVDIGVARIENAASLLARPALAAPSRGAHKYSRGFLGVVGGQMPGAGALASRAAMHGGAGYVKLFADHRSPATPDELVVDDAALDQSLSDKRLDALLIGPGLGRDDVAKTRLVKCLQADLPTVCDADALVLLEPEMLADRRSPVILTPHAGELDRLCATFTIAAQDRMERACTLAAATGATVVAKGPDTIIASPASAPIIAPPAPSWLSTAGTGDVLAGLIASRLAAGSDPASAAAEGVWLHGEAAGLAGAVFTAGNLIDAIPAAYSRCL